jgi:hypothetical protein
MAPAMTETFTQVVIAKHSPQNGCFAPDGAVLYVAPKARVPTKPLVDHRFETATRPPLRSKFGWVAESLPLTVDEFIDRHVRGVPLSEALRAHVEVMLRAVSRLNPSTPVGVYYARRGLEHPVMELVVHRVFFYRGE